MIKNNVIKNMLRKYPELKPLYSREKRMLSSDYGTITLYLFFAYVIAESLKNAIEEKNNTFVENMFFDIEVLCSENYDMYSDIVITAIFERFSFLEIEKYFSKYFGRNLKSIFEKHIH